MFKKQCELNMTLLRINRTRLGLSTVLFRQSCEKQKFIFLVHGTFFELAKREFQDSKDVISKLCCCSFIIIRLEKNICLAIRNVWDIFHRENVVLELAAKFIRCLKVSVRLWNFFNGGSKLDIDNFRAFLLYLLWMKVCMLEWKGNIEYIVKEKKPNVKFSLSNDSD